MKKMSKKGMQTKKVFNRSEVEEYVKKMLNSSEITMSEQKDRILELKQEIDKLTRTNEEQQAKIRLLQRGLSEAERASKQSAKDSSVQTKIVVEKVQQFGFKWTAYFQELFDNIPMLKDNASVELFSSDIKELVSQVIEATILRNNVDETVVPVDAEMVITEDEWMDRRLKKLAEEPKYTLSAESEDKYKTVMSRLKSTMIYASQSTTSEESKFDINEALNPKDSLDKIIDDIKA